MDTVDKPRYDTKISL
nr:hypothetical protein [Candidatus Rickettsia colombianensi]